MNFRSVEPVTREKGGSVRRAPRRVRSFGTSLVALGVAAASGAVACSSNGDPRAVGIHEKSDAAVDSGASHTDAGAAPRLVVTADWLNGSLSLLDYDKVVGSATTRDDALVGTIDLSAYPPGPLEVEVTPDGKSAVVAVGPGYFIGPVGTLIGATNIDPGGTTLLVDLVGRKVTAEMKPPAGPMGVAVSPDGKRAFTADHGSTEGTTLSVYDLVAGKLVTSIDDGLGIEEVSVSPDGTLGVVNTDSDGAIRFFDPKAATPTLSAPLVIGGDPDLAAFVPAEKKLVIAKSLTDSRGEAGYSVVDLTDPAAPSVLETGTVSGIPYGANLIPGTSHVLVTAGVAGCFLHEIDVSVSPAVVTRSITLPVTKTSLPLSTAIDATGKHAFVGAPGDNSLMVVDLGTGDVKRIPWLGLAGPTRVALTP